MPFMNFTEFVDWLKRTPATVPVTVWLPDNQPASADAGADADPDGYFEIRLCEMFLTDARQLFKTIAPATFFIADYHYNGGKVSQPLFISNELMQGVSEQIGAGKMRVRFVKTQVVGPTPYTGGDVSLFVGLFQATMADHRKTLFSVFETLFGSVGLGGMVAYIKLADKLTSTIIDALGESDVTCLLAERRPIGVNQLPASGHLVYLHSAEGKVNPAGLVVRDGFLYRNVGGTLTEVQDHNYCLVQVARYARRNDYMNMAFHKTWMEARKKMVAQQVPEAQALMLECSHQILDSPDLTEDNKMGLIEHYQAKLLAAKTLVAHLGAADTAMRSGGPALVREMQQRALLSHEADAVDLAKHFDAISKLTSKYADAPEDDNTVFAKQLGEHLEHRVRKGRQKAAALVRALATGTVGT